MQLPLFTEQHPIDSEALEACLRAPVIALDVETTTRWPGWGPRHDFGLSYCADISILAVAWREEGQIQTTALIAPFEEQALGFVHRLVNTEATIVAHNAVFDIRQLSKLSNQTVPAHIWDTMAMALLLHPATRMSYRLLGVADMLGIPYTEQHAAMKQSRAKLHEIPTKIAAKYAQQDAQLTLLIHEKQQEHITDPVLVDWECRAIYRYCQMAARGIRLNLSSIHERRTELETLKKELAARLAEDGLLTPDSPKARVRYLYVTKGIPLPDWDPDSGYFTWGGYRRLSRAANPQVTLDDLSTRSHVIESYLEEDSPYADQLKDLAAYMRADWLLSTLTSLLEHAALDERVHSLIAIATDTGRRASSHPAMQNWKMPEMAGVAIGDPGFTLVEIDYSNAENVMAALLAGDDNLSSACMTDDFHSTMAVHYFGEAWEQADPALRRRLRGLSKRISYGTAYGMGARRLAKSLDVSLDEAYAILRAKDAAFPKLARAKQLAERRVKERRQLKLWSGRPIALSQPFVAWNYICQGGVGEMLKRAIVLISEEYERAGMRSRVALDIHDALILEVAHEEWDRALEIASHTMRTIVPEELRNRTTPPIEWRAVPNLEENSKKWGSGQWHLGECC